MKKVILSLITLIGTTSYVFAQTVQDADVYPSNLPENTYFTKYDDRTKIISGINFLSLSDGTNSKYVTPPFKVKLYLYVPGTEVPIYVKTFETDGQYHMGSREFKNESVDLGSVPNLKSGTYRLGIHVDADNEVKEDNEGNNAVLFEGEIKYTAGNTASSQPAAPAVTEESDEDMEEDYNDDEDDDGGY